MIPILGLIFVCQLVLLWQVFGVKNPINPIYLLPCLYLLIGIVGYVVYSVYPEFASQGGTSLIILLTSEEKLLTLQYFLAFSNIIVFGSIGFLMIEEIVKLVRSRRTQEVLYLSNLALSNVSSNQNFNHSLILRKKIKAKKKFSIKLPPGTLTFLCMIPTIFLILGVGPDKILIKDVYLGSSFKFFVILGNVLIMPGSIGLGYNLANRLSPTSRFFCWLTVVLNALILFSIATRVLTMFPFLITLGYAFNSKGKKSVVILLIVVSLVLFSPFTYFPLYLRGQASHGLLPYIQYLSDIDLSLAFQAPLDFINNVLFSFPLTGAIMKVSAVRIYPISYLLVSVSPLPGGNAGWYSINNQLRFNAATPFNTIGEMQLYGEENFFLTFFVLGIMAGFIGLVFQKNMNLSRTFLGVILVILTFLFFINSLQYNLRTSTRILYLAVVLSGFFNKT